MYLLLITKKSNAVLFVCIHTQTILIGPTQPFLSLQCECLLGIRVFEKLLQR